MSLNLNGPDFTDLLRSALAFFGPSVKKAVVEVAGDVVDETIDRGKKIASKKVEEIVTEVVVKITFDGINYVIHLTTESAQWCWEVIQGDFYEDHTTAQIMTGAAISMIPLVDQICDIRDLIANGKKIKKDPSDFFAWLALVLTLIGLVPGVGSLLKGCLKVMFAPLRRLYLKAGKNIPTEMITEKVDDGIRLLLDYLEMKQIRETLEKMKVHESLKMLAEQITALRTKVSIDKLEAALDGILKTTKNLLDTLEPLLPKSTVKESRELWNSLSEMRKLSDQHMAKALKPLDDILEQFANRLSHESSKVYRATSGINAHKINHILDKDILKKKGTKPPYYCRKDSKTGLYPQKSELSTDEVELMETGGYPDLRETGPGHLSKKYDTFHTMEPVVLPPGTELVRIVDPGSSDNAICWMRREEFDKIKSRDQWRKEFAVKTEWNANGEYITYKVPEGSGLKVWEGPAGTQEIKDTKYAIPGGAIQIVLEPNDLVRTHVGPRQPTNWDYGEVTTKMSDGRLTIGVPDTMKLLNQWYGDNKK